MKLEDIYFDKSIKDYALKLTRNTLEAEELVSLAYDICSRKPPKENMKGYFAMVMRNQWLKKCNKKDPYYFEDESEDIDIETTLGKMNHYYAEILRSIANGDNLTKIHKDSGIGYKALKADYDKAKKEFSIMYKKETKVAIILDNLNGVAYHRLMVPIAKMSRDYGIEVTCLMSRDDAFMDAIKKDRDITHVIFNRNISGLMKPEECIVDLKARGVKVICDIDDYWELPKGHPMSYYYKKTNMSKCVVSNIKLADVVWTTTKRLADKIRPFNKNVHVVKNAIDPQENQFNYDSLSIDFDTFFYSGGNTHSQDLKLLGNYFDDEEFFVKSDKLPKRMKSIKVQLSSISDYARDYTDCGICVIPLQDNDFNRCKSELKMIEAGHFARPIIVSDVYPYKSIATSSNSIRVYNNRWDLAIKKIKGDHQRQVEMGLQLRDDIRSKFDIVKENAKRIQLL